MNSFGIEVLIAGQFKQFLKYITADLGGDWLAGPETLLDPAGDFHV